MATIPILNYTKAGTYHAGGIYTDDGVTGQTINIAPAIMGNWKTNYLAVGGVVPDATNGNITILCAGVYDVSLTVSGTFPAARTLYIHVAIDGAIAPMGGIKRGGSGGVVPSVGGGTHGILNLAANAVLTAQVSTDVDTQTFTMLEASFVVHLID